jgi:hypothetical protein
MARFGLYVGFYTQDEIDSPLFTDSLHDFMNENGDADFWLQVGVGIWNPKTTKSTSFRDPLHRYLHRCIAHSIANNHDIGNVGRINPFFLYYLVTNRRCNLV